MKVVAAFQATVEVLVELGEHETWEGAAKAALEVAKKPPPVPDAQLSLDRIWLDEGEGNLFQGHEIVGTCAKCGEAIVEGCGPSGCDGKAGHAPSKGGWVSTEHGHMIWCSQACRDADPNDIEREE